MIEAIATDAAFEETGSAAPHVGRRTRHAMEYMLIAGVADAPAEAAKGSEVQACERRANPRPGRLIPRIRAANAASGERVGRCEKKLCWGAEHSTGLTGKGTAGLSVSFRL